MSAKSPPNNHIARQRVRELKNCIHGSPHHVACLAIYWRSPGGLLRLNAAEYSAGRVMVRIGSCSWHELPPDADIVKEKKS